MLDYNPYGLREGELSSGVSFIFLFFLLLIYI